ncbi:MAG: MFS transporter, partial [Candidatus Dormibacteraeota bacterium]|nr:MFS transporter [Candidatus Dormibacteraeota bacterium]
MSTQPAHRPLRPSLGDHRFVALLIALTINSIGSWASAIALWGFAAYRFNANATTVALLIVCWAAPPVFLGPVLGVVIDRFGPQRSLIVGYLGGMGAALGMAAANALPTLAIAAIASGVATTLAAPAANALPPRLVDADGLLAANSLLAGARQAGQVLGPLTASATFALAGFRAAFLLDAATYLVGVWAVATLRCRPVPPSPRSPWANELAGGVLVVARHPVLRLIIGLGAGVSFTSGAFLVVEPLYARHVLERPPSQFALFEAAAGAGAIAASLAVSRLRSPHLLEGVRPLALSAGGYGLTACIFIGTTWVPVAYVGVTLWGVTGAVFSVVAVTTMQQIVPA